MKILVTNHSLANIGGSETFTYTFVEELVRRGHNVDVFSPTLGFVAEKIRELGVKVSRSFSKEYDAIFSSHQNTLRKILDIGVKGRKIHTMHGTIHHLERPMEGADEYVSVSKEVDDSVDIDTHIIYNGVNLDRFEASHPNTDIQVVGCLCQGNTARSMVRKLCERNGYKFVDINKSKNIWHVEELIAQCDIVFTLGRGAIESLSCGKNVFVFDSRSYMEPFSDGIVTPANYKDIMTCNFSGRCTGKIIRSVEELEDELVNYNSGNFIYYRDIARTHFNIRKQVLKYLDLV